MARISPIAAVVVFAGFLAACRHAPLALPDLTFATALGETVRLHGMKGDIVFLHFWSAACGPCRESNEAARRLDKRFAPRQVRMVGVSEDASKDSWKDGLIKTPSSLIELFDDRHALQKQLRATLPAAFLIDRTGRIRYRFPRWSAASEAEVARRLGELLAEPDASSPVPRTRYK